MDYHSRTFHLVKDLEIDSNWDMNGEGDLLDDKSADFRYTQRLLPEWNRASQKGEINPDSELSYDIVKGKFGGVDNKEVVDFAVGCRTTKTLRLVTDTLILSNARMVYTDKLRQYASLLPIAIHLTTQYGTNHIERKNLSLRTHLKRLGRRTICFSRSFRLLQACLAIYFWG